MFYRHCNKIAEEQEKMWETMWDDIYSNHKEILRKASEYNTKTAQSDYTKCSEALDISFYYDLIVAHIINLLIDDPSLYVPNALQPILTEYDSKITSFVKWYRNDLGSCIRIDDDLDDAILLEN